MKTILSHANLIDCVEPKVRPNTAVLIEDGRIRAILPSGKMGSADGAQVIDLDGLYLMPGLWDVHIHPDYLSVNDMPLADQFWGDRYGQLIDPFGHRWAIATHIEDLTPEQMQQRSVAAMADMPKPGQKPKKKKGEPSWKKIVGISLALAAFLAYFNGFRNGYDKGYHRHELYHYYLGAKYFPEMGYDALYRCTVVAQSDRGLEGRIDEEARSVEIVFGHGTPFRRCLTAPSSASCGKVDPVFGASDALINEGSIEFDPKSGFHF